MMMLAIVRFILMIESGLLRELTFASLVGYATRTFSSTWININSILETRKKLSTENLSAYIELPINLALNFAHYVISDNPNEAQGYGYQPRSADNGNKRV